MDTGLFLSLKTFAFPLVPQYSIVLVESKYGTINNGDEMTKLQKRLIVLIGILTVLMLSVSVSLFNALYINPNQLDVEYKKISDSKIPEDMGIFSIVYFTDLEYGTYQNDERTTKLFEQIQALDPDILIFGGDLYDQEYAPNDESNAKLIEYFNSIEAPLGKFCVLGEMDALHNDTVRAVYAQSGVEILENSSVHIGAESRSSICLTGLSTTPDVSVASALSSAEFNIILAHYPDTLHEEGLAIGSIDLGLAGHSHYRQLAFPLMASNSGVEGASNDKSLSFDTILSNGIGCTKADARLNSDPQLHYLLLSH